MARERHYDLYCRDMAMLMEILFGPTEVLCSYDTCQFDDYSKYVAPRFDPRQKAKRREEVFPGDCEKAFALGVRLAEGLV